MMEFVEENIIEPYGFIYITVNIINGKKYIGQKTFDNKSRWKAYVGGGLHLMKSVKKYGKHNFIKKIIDIAYSFEQLNELEYEWIKIHDAVKSEDYYNMIDGGTVIESMHKGNSTPIICIDNNVVYESLSEASLFFRTNIVTMKKTFEKTHDISNFNIEKPIFRKIHSFEKNIKLCMICGVVLNTPTKCSSFDYLCETCCLKKEELKIDKIKLKNYKKCCVCGSLFIMASSNHTYCKKCSKERQKEIRRISSRKKYYKNKNFDVST